MLIDTVRGTCRVCVPLRNAKLVSALYINDNYNIHILYIWKIQYISLQSENSEDDMIFKLIVHIEQSNHVQEYYDHHFHTLNIINALFFYVGSRYI